MDKNSFLFYYSYFDKLGWCSDVEFRNIVKAMVCFDRDGELIELTEKEKIAFDMIRIDLEQNRQKYNDKCEKNRQISLNRWEKEKSSKK